MSLNHNTGSAYLSFTDPESATREAERRTRDTHNTCQYCAIQNNGIYVVVPERVATREFGTLIATGMLIYPEYLQVDPTPAGP